MQAADLLLMSRSRRVKELAAELGFSECRVAIAQKLDKEARQLERWLDRGYQGEMTYLENYFDLRTDPRLLVPGAKSVVMLSCNYFPKTELKGTLKLSKYAYGEDYHRVIRRRLKAFIRALNSAFGEVQGRGFVDSAPVMEKAWAVRSGLGWMGKNTNVITKGSGSFFFLAALVIDLPLWPDQPVADHCGTCTRCIDVCPTNALHTPYELDAKRCISYLTIELKSAIPEEFKNQMDNWVFGCDLCQDVCPWNRFSVPHNMPEFEPSNGLAEMVASEWTSLTDQRFNIELGQTALKRTGYRGLMRNIQFMHREAPAT